LPPGLADWLREHGHGARHVNDIGLGSGSDRAVWDEARRAGAIIVSKDEDFIIRRRDVEGPQVLWIRTGNTTRRALVLRFEAVWSNLSPLLEAGQPVVELR
ncbi:MAG: DUF5615 family PIN-like protein, partial [Alphaproteobacteria bacterium]|nr:DUF5615 family PIN-like protein [Alphaproteobacteria bacterium]